MGFEYYLVLEKPVDQSQKIIESLFTELDSLYEKNGLDFYNSSAFDPFFFELGDDLIEEFQENHPETRFKFNPATQSRFSFDCISADKGPLTPNFLNSLNKQIKILLIEPMDGSLISFDQMVEEFSRTEFLTQEIEALRGKDLAELKSMNLRNIFRHSKLEDYIPSKVSESLGDLSQSVEKLFLSERQDDWRLANRKINLEGLAISKVISTFIREVKSLSSDRERIVLAHSLYVIFRVCEVGIASSEAIIKSTEPFYLTNEKVKSDYIQNARQELTGFFDELKNSTSEDERLLAASAIALRTRASAS